MKKALIMILTVILVVSCTGCIQFPAEDRPDTLYVDVALHCTSDLYGLAYECWQGEELVESGEAYPADRGDRLESGETVNLVQLHQSRFASGQKLYLDVYAVEEDGSYTLMGDQIPLTVKFGSRCTLWLEEDPEFGCYVTVGQSA